GAAVAGRRYAGGGAAVVVRARASAAERARAASCERVSRLSESSYAALERACSDRPTAKAHTRSSKHSTAMEIVCSRLNCTTVLVLRDLHARHNLRLNMKLEQRAVRTPRCRCEEVHGSQVTGALQRPDQRRGVARQADHA